ncbi:MAG: class I SAM-dependent methyltransferase [Deltaproteobacteria bacterium]|nr:class I SAM-dependent methyltransferase [Deltaproteobacteria bacterium]
MTTAPEDPAVYRSLWDRKPVLRAVYADIYRHILDAAAPGSILEIGGGSGNFKQFAPATVSTDILPAPWLDVVCDAQRLPFASGQFANIVMIDVVHHIENPLYFLKEASRVLCTGGRLIFCEPAITPLSHGFYRLFHPEPVDMSVDPLKVGGLSADKNPWDSNQAIPTLLVGPYRDALARELPELRLARLDWFSFLAYPLSGGFRPWSLLPEPAARPLLAGEWCVRRIFGRLAGFRLLAIYEQLETTASTTPV